MILDTTCIPIPPSDITKRLKQVHPSLGMFFVRNAASVSWGFTETWGEFDPRREEIKKGTLAPDRDFDILGFAPVGVSQEEAFGYLTRALRNRPATKDDYNEMLTRVTNYNAEQSRENTKDVREFAAEMVETNAKTLWRNEGKSIPKVYQNESSAKRSRKGR